MNPIDDQLKRLFQAASQATPEPVLVPPYGLETRVLADWRARRSDLWDMTLLVQGLILASLIMGISLWPLASKTANPNPLADYLQLADSTVQMDSTP